MSRVRRSNSRTAPSGSSQLDLFGASLEAKDCRRPVTKEAKPDPPPLQSVAPFEAPNAANGVDQRLLDFVTGAHRRRGRQPKDLLPGDGTPADERRLLDVREAAARLGLSKSTLDKMRCSGRGPRFIRATDRAIRYDPEDLRAFADERRQRSTSHIVEALNA